MSAASDHPSTPIIGFDHVQVVGPIGCEPDARAFYGELLGLDEVAKPVALRSRGGVWFRCGDNGLHVGVSDAHVASPKAHPALRVASMTHLNQLVDRIEQAGHRVEWADVPIAEARCKVHDPFGNLIELLVGTTG